MARKVELAGGGVAVVAGLVVAAVIQAFGGAGWAVTMAAVSGLGAGVGAYQHALRGGASWLALLWAAAVGLTALMVLAIFSVGILLLPGAIAAWAAAIAGSSRAATA